MQKDQTSCRKCYVRYFGVAHTAIHAKKIASSEHVPGLGEKGNEAHRAGRTSDFPGRGPGIWQKRSKGRDPAWPASVQARPHFFRPIVVSGLGEKVAQLTSTTTLKMPLRLPFYPSPHSCGCRSPLETPTVRRLVFVRMPYSVPCARDVAKRPLR
jgi:hypothetical protein